MSEKPSAGPDFSPESFEGRTFKKLALADEPLRRKEFNACAFEQCDFGAADLSNASFLDCRFTGCNFANAKADNARFKAAHFEDCKLVGIAFGRVQPFLLDWSFERCKLQFCSFAGLKAPHSCFIDCVLHEDDFSNADLRESSFAGSDLKASKFHHSGLEMADFSGARGYYIDPTANRVKGAKFSWPEALNLLAGFGVVVEG